MKPSPDLYVNLGLPSGTLWAKTNLDASQANGFAISAIQYGCSYVSWGNTVMHNPVSDSAFDYDFGGRNSQAPWYDGQPYGETPGCSIMTNIGLSGDVARILAGVPWRMPSEMDFVELFANTEFIDANGDVIPSSTADKRVNVDGIVGIYLKSKINDARIFFAACGEGSQSNLANLSAGGYYWSSTFVDDSSAKAMRFSGNDQPAAASRSRFLGYPIRPVWRDVR